MLNKEFIKIAKKKVFKEVKRKIKQFYKKKGYSEEEAEQIANATAAKICRRIEGEE